MDILKRYFEILAQFPNAERREAQERMIEGVANSLTHGETLIVEAGTGAGKSFGYLIPALLHQPESATYQNTDGETKKKPIVISTAAIALQEQLLDKDIPFLSKALNRPDLQVRLVKGRGNYLCIQKMTELERQLRPDSGERLHLNYLKAELEQGWDGDQATLELAVPSELWQEIRSDSEDCLGRRCQFYPKNPYRKAREDLDQADILIVNHALYLQDASAAQALLPRHDTVIFDEAHQLKHYALNAFTVRVGKYAAQKLLRKIHRRIQPLPEQFHSLLADAEAALLEWLFRSDRSVYRLPADPFFLYLVKRQIEVLKELDTWLSTLNVRQLSLVESELDADRAHIQREKLLQQLRGLILRWEFFKEEDLTPSAAQERVNWVETDRDRLYYELKSTPLNTADLMNKLIWSERTAVLTSATLAVNNGMAYAKRDLGIQTGNDLLLASPFQYETQCVLYLPRHLPDPNTQEYSEAIIEEIEALVRLSQGRAFVLFTGHQAMGRVAQALIPRLPYPCKIQGEWPRNKLVAWFQETPNSIIFATATFWEGIDIPGEALSCVIMDRIPFSPPGDPINQAIVDGMKARGEDWFGQAVLPPAIIRLKQGFGRLIRTRQDRGLVAILDPRIRQKGYGRQIQRSLPKTPVVNRIEDILPQLFSPCGRQNANLAEVIPSHVQQ
jgi:ATP-dependent DNA helicase DinG